MDSQDEHRASLIRQVRQRLESLGRAGVDRMPAPTDVPPAPPAKPAEAVSEDEAHAPGPIAVPLRLAAEAPAVLPSSSLFGDPELDDMSTAPAERPARLAALAAEVSVCRRCPHLAATRTQTVFGV